MKDWIVYIKENLESDIWGFIFLDYYYNDSNEKYGEEFEKYKPEQFIDDEISKLYEYIKDPVHFHKVLLKVCVQLLFDSNKGAETSMNLILSKSYNFLVKYREILNEEQIEAIITHYGSSNNENSYRKKDIFKKYLISRGFIIERSLHTPHSVIKDVCKRKEIKTTITSERKDTQVYDRDEIRTRNMPVVAILTALPEEYLAVRNNLIEVAEADKEDTTYEEGIFEFNERKIARVIIRECGVGNTIASQETERAIQYFSPSLILFVGIAGSRKPNDFSLGDVIFPIKIFSYEGGKSGKDSFRARPDLVTSTYKIYEIAKKERRKDDWKKLIKKTWYKDSNAKFGVIASGEQLIEHYDSEIGRILTKHYDDTSAVEMEGFGFAKAVTRQGGKNQNIQFGVVRGISDIIEQTDKSKIVEDRRPEDMKHFASDTAAAFTFWLIFKTYNQQSTSK